VNLIAPRDPPADPATIIHCVLEAGEAQLRMHHVQGEPSVRRTSSPARRLVNIGGDVSDFTPHERAVFRALAEKFPPDKCVQMVLRARQAAR
jgi:hypothetical protein